MVRAHRAAAHRNVEQCSARALRHLGEILGRVRTDRGVDRHDLAGSVHRQQRGDHLAHLVVVEHHHRDEVAHRGDVARAGRRVGAVVHEGCHRLGAHVVHVQTARPVDEV